jgi:hypothetical protein
MSMTVRWHPAEKFLIKKITIKINLINQFISTIPTKMSQNSENIIIQCMNNVFLSMQNEHRNISENPEAPVPNFGVGLNQNYNVMSMINESLLPGFLTKEEVIDELGDVEYDYEEDEAGEFTPHMNGHILNVEGEMRKAAVFCKCDDCITKEEDFEHWLWNTVQVTIDDSYEFHGRVIGAHKQREFRLKYSTNVSEDCKMYTVCNEFTQLLNEMHVKLNHKFITKYEFLRPMEKIIEEMEKTEYNADKVIINLYTFIERVYGKDYQEYDNICLTFFQNISVEEYIRRWGIVPYGEYNFFKNRDYTQYFEDNDTITDRANELCFSTEQLYPDEEPDEPEQRLNEYPAYSAFNLITLYSQNRKQVLADNCFEFERLYDTDPLTLEGPKSVENGVNGVRDAFDYGFESDGSEASEDDSEDMSVA